MKLHHVSSDRLYEIDLQTDTQRSSAYVLGNELDQDTELG